MYVIPNPWPRRLALLWAAAGGVACTANAGFEEVADETILLQLSLESSSSSNGGLQELDLTSPAAISARGRRKLEENLSPSSMLARARAMAGPPPGTNINEPFRQVMVNFGDAQYIGYFTIGHQLVGGIVDTGSYELVIFSSVCSTCGAAAEYNPWLSSSYSMGFLKTTHSYGSGETFSEEADDLVSIGPFSDTNQYFWEVTKANMPILYSAAFQAIIGIGPPETPASDAWDATVKATGNVTDTLNQSQKVPQELLQSVSDNLEVAMEMSVKTPLLQTFNVSMFSMCFGKRPGSDGYFIWNDYSAYQYPNVFKRVAVVGRHSWSVWLNNVRIQGVDDAGQPNGTIHLGCSTGCSAIMDSGTSLLAVPGFVKSKLESIMSRANSDCSNLQDFPDLVFDMGGHTFSLPPDAYVAEVVGTVPNYLEGYVKIRPRQIPFEPRTRCQLLLMESYASTTYGPLWILGVPFFRKYYTTFHIGKSHSERSLFVAPASKDCKPLTNQAALYTSSRSTPRLKTAPNPSSVLPRVDASKIFLPPIARVAASKSFVRL